MNAPASGATRVGYEPALLAQLRADHRQQLAAVGQAWAVSCLLLGLPMAVAVYKTEHHTVLAGLAGLATALLALNALRLVIAGSGVAPHLPLPRNYRPSATTGFLIGALALMMSQPIQLMLASPAADAAVEAHRAELVEAHRALQRSMDLPIDDGFAAQTADCEFVVLRLALLWSSPTRNILYSGLYTLLVLFPFLLMRTWYLPAVQAYEAKRHRRAVLTVAAAERLTRARVEVALGQFASYRGGPGDLGQRGVA